MVTKRKKEMITRQCRKCGQLHEIVYVYHKNSTKHLILLHPTKKGKRSDIYIPYEENLDIRTVLTKAQSKATAPREAKVAGQISLLI